MAYNASLLSFPFPFQVYQGPARWQISLFEAWKRYGICNLDHANTANHIHPLAEDTGKAGSIARSIQLAAGKTAQEFNHRKARKGAFREDRYHDTAVEPGDHPPQSLDYIALETVRTGAVAYPGEWRQRGYYEIRHPRQRYRLIDRERLRNPARSSVGDVFLACTSYGEEALRMIQQHVKADGPEVWPWEAWRL